MANFAQWFVPLALLVGGLVEFLYLRANGLGQVFPLVAMDIGNLLPWLAWGGGTLLILATLLFAPVWFVIQAESVCKSKRDRALKYIKKEKVLRALEILPWLAVWAFIMGIGLENIAISLLGALIIFVHVFRYGIGAAQAMRWVFYGFAYLFSLWPMLFAMSAIRTMSLTSDMEQWLVLLAFVLSLAGFYAALVYRFNKHGFKGRRGKELVTVSAVLLVAFVLFLSMSNFFKDSMVRVGIKLGYSVTEAMQYLVPREELPLGAGISSFSPSASDDKVWVSPKQAFVFGGLEVLCFHSFIEHVPSLAGLHEDCLVRREGVAPKWIVRELFSGDKG